MSDFGTLVPDRRRAPEYCLTVLEVSAPEAGEKGACHEGEGEEVFLMRAVGGAWHIISRVAWKLSDGRAEPLARELGKSNGIRFVPQAFPGREARLSAADKAKLRKADQDEERERKAQVREETQIQRKLRAGAMSKEYDREDLDGVKAPKRIARRKPGRRFRAPDAVLDADADAE